MSKAKVGLFGHVPVLGLALAAVVAAGSNVCQAAAPFPDGTLIRNEPGCICIMVGGSKRYVCAEVFKHLGGDKSTVNLSNADFDAIPTGRPYVPSGWLVRSSTGCVCYVEGETFRWVPSDVFRWWYPQHGGTIVQLPDDVWSAFPGGAPFRPARPFHIDLDALVKVAFICNGQPELKPADRGWTNGDNAEFKMGGNAWYKLYKPQWSVGADGKATISCVVHHMRGWPDKPDVAVVILHVESKTGKLLDVQVKTEIAGEGKVDGGVVKVIADDTDDPRAAAAAAIAKGVSALRNWLAELKEGGGRLQFPTVIEHCTNAILQHIVTEE
jgi:hypothetical protein